MIFIESVSSAPDPNDKNVFTSTNLFSPMDRNGGIRREGMWTHGGLLGDQMSYDDDSFN